MNKYTVYFGGSFFPPHRGHDDMLRHLLALDEVVSLRLVPTFQNPLKQSNSQGFWEREGMKKELVEHWVQEVQKIEVSGVKKLSVEWIELEREVPTFTYDTLRVLKEESPAAEGSDWVICVGDDCLPDLHRWKEIEKLLNLVKEFWVFPRGDMNTAAKRTLIEQIDPSLREKTVWRMMAGQAQAVSSTEVRQSIESGNATQELLNEVLLAPLSEYLLRLQESD